MFLLEAEGNRAEEWELYKRFIRGFIIIRGVVVVRFIFITGFIFTGFRGCV